MSFLNPEGKIASEIGGIVSSRVGGLIPSGRGDGKGDLGLVVVTTRSEYSNVV